MNRNDAALWLETVLGGLEGWINLRAIEPDQAKPPRTEFVRTTTEALAWCERMDGAGFNLYAGLARRGEQRDDDGKIVGGESNLLGCQVLWVDLDSGDKNSMLRRVREFPIRPALVIDSGGGIHALWRLCETIDCVASGTPENAALRMALKGIQLTLGGDPAVVDASRIFRIAGTTNYPNGRKRAQGRGVTESKILESAPYEVALDDFDEFMERAKAEAAAASANVVHSHGERLPQSVALVLSRQPRMHRVFFCEERLSGGNASEEDFALACGIWKYAPWLRERDVVAALRYRRRALAHKVLGSEKSDSYYVSTSRKARSKVFELASRPTFETAPAAWFNWTIQHATNAQSKPMIRDDASGETQPPRISSSIADLDTATNGGVYGLTVVAGDSGVGKSTVALNAAIEAKRRGWDVLYVAAEMHTAEYHDRAARYLGIDRESVAGNTLVPTIAEVADGLDLTSLLDMIACFATEETKRIFLVLDSLTKVAAFIDRSGNEFSLFDSMMKLVRLGEQAVRIGEHRIAVLMTSELNKDGAVLGRRATYSSSLDVRMMADKKQPDLVYLAIPKARHSGKRGQWGPYMQDWRNHRLEPLFGASDNQAEERE